VAGIVATLPLGTKRCGLSLFAPAPPATPHPRRSEAETFRNSRHRGLTTTVRWSVPAFLLQAIALGGAEFSQFPNNPIEVYNLPTISDDGDFQIATFSKLIDMSKELFASWGKI
jgi:hypothetical protein